jgi:hypothetical protein
MGRHVAGLDGNSLQARALAMTYLIKRGDWDYWNNRDGWGPHENADVFSEADKKRLRLPIGGRWVVASRGGAS